MEMLYLLSLKSDKEKFDLNVNKLAWDLGFYLYFLLGGCVFSAWEILKTAPIDTRVVKKKA